jgi:hypothetical protein
LIETSNHHISNDLILLKVEQSESLDTRQDDDAGPVTANFFSENGLTGSVQNQR